MKRHLYTARLAIRWGDMDAFRHVNNSRYFTYFEQARLAWLDEALPDWQGEETGPILARTACDFKRPIVYPASLIIHVEADAPGRTSFTTYYDVRTEDEPDVTYAYGEGVIVWIDYQTGRPVPLPEALREAYAKSNS